jgi:iron complex outermembrane receptor protein
VAAAALLLLSLPVRGAEVPTPTRPAFMIVAGDTLWLADPLEVLGSRVPVALPGVVRTMNVITESELDGAAGRSAAELLQTVPGVVVSQRSQYGVQSDLTLRGSTFDQVQILLNGFDAGDPQTGHHALDLPVTRRDISRLEVLPGHGSSLYGAGAFGGTVNVVTRRPGERDGGRVELTGGDHGLWGAQAEAELRLGPHTGSRFTGERFRTDGHDVDRGTPDQAWGRNDADTWTGSGRVVHEGAGGEWDLFGAYSDRQYGALDFYAPFPSYEKTRSTFVSGLYRRDLSDRVTLEPRIFFRRHRDEFVLFREKPTAYTNDHVTRKTGGELRGVVRVDDVHAVAMSAEAVYEDIDSRGLRSGVWGTALGSHLRRRLSAAAEINRNGGPVRWQVGGRIDRQSGYDARFSGSGAAAWEMSSRFTLRTSGGSVYRVPTFTDLYYRDPANLGNSGLVPETGWTWDTGLECNLGAWSAYATYYERYEKDLIQWARPLGDTVWHVLNIAEGKTRGGEFQGEWRHAAGHRLGAGWSWIEKSSDLPSGFEGKYALLVPRHVVNLQAVMALDRKLSWTLGGRFVEHTGGPADFASYFVMDSRISWRGDSGWLASLTGTNLTDHRYEEVPGVQMPGTVFTGSLGYEF